MKVLVIMTFLLTYSNTPTEACFGDFSCAISQDDGYLVVIVKVGLLLHAALPPSDTNFLLHLQNLDVRESKGTSWRALSSAESTPSSFSVLLGALSQLAFKLLTKNTGFTDVGCL